MNLSTLTRRSVLGGAAGLAAASASAAEPMHDVTFVEDFDELWRTLAERYCFFGDKQTDWGEVRSLYRPRALAAETPDDFVDVVRRVLAELYDAHTHLSDPPDGAPRWPLYDLMAEPAEGALRIVAVQEESAASAAGILIGDRVLAIEGRPVREVIDALTPRCLRRPDPAAAHHVANVAVGGRTAMPRRFSVRSGDGAAREVLLPLVQRPRRPDLDSRRLNGGVGYIAIRSFGDTTTVDAFDAALESLKDAPGLIIDVRGNGGGDTAVARPIMGRFISEPRPYATMRRREGSRLSAPWTETVEPRGPFTFTRPVVVLANHWSGSMAEGFPMGMRDIGLARIVGTRMMGLGAAVLPLRLDRTGIEAQYSGEPVYDTRGRPRWLLRPDIEVAEGGDVLAAGLAEMARLMA